MDNINSHASTAENFAAVDMSKQATEASNALQLASIAERQMKESKNVPNEAFPEKTNQSILPNLEIILRQNEQQNPWMQNSRPFEQQNPSAQSPRPYEQQNPWAQNPRPYEQQNPWTQYPRPYEQQNPWTQYPRPYEQQNPWAQYPRPYEQQNPWAQYPRPYEQQNPWAQYPRPYEPQNPWAQYPRPYEQQNPWAQYPRPYEQQNPWSPYPAPYNFPQPWLPADPYNYSPWRNSYPPYFPCPWMPHPNYPSPDNHPWEPHPQPPEPGPKPKPDTPPHDENNHEPKPTQRHHGVNLSGAEFGGNILPGKLGKEYTFPTTQELDYYKGKGMDLVRVPFLWERMQPGLMSKHSAEQNVDRSFDSTYASQMETFLNAADQRGMKVVLDAQQFGRFNQQVIGNSNITNDDFKQFWQQMAGRFGKHSSIYGYDLSNEPHDEDTKVWTQAAQAGLDGIRAAGDEKTVIVEGNSWAGTQSWRDVNENLSVNDSANNVVYSAHSYWDTDHSGTYNGGASSYDNAVREAHNRGVLSANEDPSAMGVNYAKPFVDWLKQHNYRGYIGEFGVPSNDANWVKVQDKFLSYARENNLDTTAWGGGPWWGPGYNLSLERGQAGERSIDGPEPLNLKSITNDGKETMR